ncbi:hypothetical protein [Streptomyces sp. NPDC048644]|uniref:hypothetical protein n=1 Tax=Streptomyces sp. NPDC048644 TaxID=3365582 RepID=UPI003717A233
MRTFLLGLALGATSAGFTYALSADPRLAAIAGAIVAIACWLGIAAIVLTLDD